MLFTFFKISLLFYISRLFFNSIVFCLSRVFYLLSVFFLITFLREVISVLMFPIGSIVSYLKNIKSCSIF